MAVGRLLQKDFASLNEQEESVEKLKGEMGKKVERNEKQGRDLNEQEESVEKAKGEEEKKREG